LYVLLCCFDVFCASRFSRIFVALTTRASASWLRAYEVDTLPCGAAVAFLFIHGCDQSYRHQGVVAVWSRVDTEQHC